MPTRHRDRRPSSAGYHDIPPTPTRTLSVKSSPPSFSVQTSSIDPQVSVQAHSSEENPAVEAQSIHDQQDTVAHGGDLVINGDIPIRRAPEYKQSISPSLQSHEQNIEKLSNHVHSRRTSRRSSRKTSHGSGIKTLRSSVVADRIRRLLIFRARVEYEVIGIEEQKNYIDMKHAEASRQLANLDVEIGAHLTSSTPAGVDGILAVLSKLKQNLAEIDQAREQLGSMRKILTEKDQRLDIALKRMYRDASGEEPPDMIDLLQLHIDETASLMSTPARQQTVHDDIYSDPFYEEDETPTEDDSNRSVLEQPGYDRASPRSLRSDDHDGHASPHLDQEGTLDENPWNDDSTTTLATDANSPDVCFLGCQFQLIISQIDGMEDDLDSLSEETVNSDMIWAKRWRDLAPVLELSPSAEQIKSHDLEETLHPKDGDDNLARHVGRWLWQIFALSWLELSHFIWFSKQFATIERVVICVGYIHLDTLIHANWFSDRTEQGFGNVGSIVPSASHFTDDVPQYRQQIFVRETVNGSESFEYYHLSGAHSSDSSGFWAALAKARDIGHPELLLSRSLSSQPLDSNEQIVISSPDQPP